MRRFSVLLLLQLLSLLLVNDDVRPNCNASSTRPTRNTPAAVSASLDGESGASYRLPETEESSNRSAASLAFLLVGRHSSHMSRLMNGDGHRFRRYVDFYFNGADDGKRRSRGRKPDGPVYVSVHMPKTASNEWTSDQDMIAYPADTEVDYEEEEEPRPPTPSVHGTSNGAQTMRRSGRRGKQRAPLLAGAATETASGGHLQERVKYEDVRPRDGRYYEDDGFDYSDRNAQLRRHRPASVEGEFTSRTEIEFTSSRSSSPFSSDADDDDDEIQTSTRNAEEATIVFENDVNRMSSTLRPPGNVGQTPPVLFVHELNGADGDHMDTNNDLRGDQSVTVKSTDDCDGELCRCFTSSSYVLGFSWMGYMMDDYRILLMTLVVLTLFFANCTLLVCVVKLFKRHRMTAVAHDWDVEDDGDRGAAGAALASELLSSTDLKRTIGELSGYRKKRLSCLMYGRLRNNGQLLRRYFDGIGPRRLTSMDFPLLLADLQPNLHLRRIKRSPDTAASTDDGKRDGRHSDETGGDDRHRIDLTDGLQRFLYARTPRASARLAAGGHDVELEDFDDDDYDSPTAPLLQKEEEEDDVAA